MARANQFKPSGNAGEISPRLHARTDFSKYGAAWALCENITPLAEGASQRRAGTRYVHALGDQTKRGWLMAFQFSNEQAYPLIVEEEAIYFNRNQGRILVADTDAAVANGTFDSDITGWDDVSSGSASASHELVGGLEIDTLSESEVGTQGFGDLTGNRVNVGFQFTASGDGDLKSVIIEVKESITAFDSIARLYTDSAGSPGTQVGGNSATVNIAAAGLKTYTWSTKPSVTSGNTYWIVITDETATGSTTCELSQCADQGSAYGSGFHDTITSIADASGSFNSSRDVRIKIQFENSDSNGALALEGNGTDIAAAEQDVTTSNTDQEHVLAFRVIGAPGDVVSLRIGNTSGGDQILADMEVATGWHVVAFTPTMSPFYVGFRNEANKTLYIDDVSLLDNEALCLTSPYAEADLQNIVPVQSADVMYLFHQSYPTYKLLRFGHTTWSLQRVAWEDGPYLTENTESSKTLQPSATSGNGITITASGHSPFVSTDVGRLVRLHPSGEPGYAVITEYVGPEQVMADVKRDFASTSATANWRLGSWSDTTGWPKCGLFYEQRLLAAATSDQPQSFWGSQTADFENLRPDSYVSSAVAIEDDDAYDYTISSNQVDSILWMAASADDMFIGTNGGEWRPSSNGATLTPTDITVRRQVSSKAADIQPISIDNVALFVQKGKRKIRELGFNFEADGYRALDMTRLAQHITYGNIREIAYAEEPESQVFCLLETGYLLSMTFRREEDVVGWTRHVIGGSFSSGDAVVESVVVIPGNDGSGQTHDSTNRDEVWVIVKRTINGGTKRYVEFFERDHEDGFDVEDAFYVDSGLTYDGTSVTTITGLDHLEGETVKVWADGDVQADKTVSSGQITISAANVVQVGLGYTHKLRNLKMEGGAAAGTAVTKRKRIVKMGFVVQHSYELKYGPDSSNLNTVDMGGLTGASNNLYTGEHTVDWPDGWKDDPRIYIESNAPAPFVLLALAPETDTKDLV